MRPSAMEDPRDRLQKADRWELVEYAKANGVVLPYGENTPHLISEQILRGRGLTNPPIRDVPLGSAPVLGFDHQPASQTVDAASDFARQFAQQAADPPYQPVKTAKLSINELRNECKKRGIKLSRRDRIEDMKAKLDGK